MQLRARSKCTTAILFPCLQSFIVIVSAVYCKCTGNHSPRLAPLVLPVESAVVDLLELPGLGLAVATYHQAFSITLCI